MTLGLAMLVKDEAERIEPTLERVLEVIDAWTIIDTGSTDGTKKIIRRTLRGKPGQLLTSDFDGFGPTRTRLLRAAATAADYTLMLDADHIAHVEGERPLLTADSYLVKINDSWGGRLPLLTRSAHPFEYRGVAHSYLASDQPTRTEETDWINVDGGPGASPEKLRRDRALLEETFAADPSDPRTVFYLAQTYRDLDDWERAIFFYRLRAGMRGFDEETFFARYQLGVLLCEHVSFAQGADELLKAWRERPGRVEPLRALANAATNVADKTPMPKDRLFVRPDFYRKAA